MLLFRRSEKKWSKTINIAFHFFFLSGKWLICIVFPSSHWHLEACCEWWFQLCNNKSILIWMSISYYALILRLKSDQVVWFYKVYFNNIGCNFNFCCSELWETKICLLNRTAASNSMIPNDGRVCHAPYAQLSAELIILLGISCSFLLQTDILYLLGSAFCIVLFSAVRNPEIVTVKIMHLEVIR